MYVLDINLYGISKREFPYSAERPYYRCPIFGQLFMILDMFFFLHCNICTQLTYLNIYFFTVICFFSFLGFGSSFPYILSAISILITKKRRETSQTNAIMQMIIIALIRILVGDNYSLIRYLRCSVVCPSPRVKCQTVCKCNGHNVLYYILYLVTPKVVHLRYEWDPCR